MRYGKEFIMAENLYYLNQTVNRLRLTAKDNSYDRWKLGSLLHAAEMEGCAIEVNKETGHITVTK